MTNGLLIRRARVQVPPSPPNENGSLTLGITPHSVSSEPSKNAENGMAPGKRSHIPGTVPEASSEVIRVRGFRGVPLEVEVNRVHPPAAPALRSVLQRFEESVRVGRAELTALRAKLVEQVDAIDAALSGAPLPLPVYSHPRRSVASSTVVKVLREGRLTANQAARMAGVKLASAKNILAKAIKEGLIVKEGWGSRAHYRLVDMGDS